MSKLIAEGFELDTIAGLGFSKILLKDILWLSPGINGIPKIMAGNEIVYYYISNVNGVEEKILTTPSSAPSGVNLIELEFTITEAL